MVIPLHTGAAVGAVDLRFAWLWAGVIGHTRIQSSVWRGGRLPPTTVKPPIDLSGDSPPPKATMGMDELVLRWSGEGVALISGIH